ncbi:MAG: hypothetical protein SFU53_06610 [Terrimicrobiaceae bacterium]|nr:hypothetical protein [Terrimicrobiaceae bacterium]
MFLQSVAHAEPPTVLRQEDCWELLRASGAMRGLRTRSIDLLEKILLGDSGIATRRFVAPDPLQLIGLDAEGLHREFEKAAPALAGEAVEKACVLAGRDVREIDALLICTCTGYLCPGLTSYVSERLGLRQGIFLQDLLGLGCGAAIPMLEAARGVAAASPGALIATVAVEVCSAAFYLDDDPGVLVSLCLFGDGAACALWSGEGEPGHWKMGGFRTVHHPEHREKIRFVNAGGKLKNQLHRAVPGLAAEAVAGLFDRRAGEPDRILSHTGGRDVIEAIEERLGRGSFVETRSVLRKNGNVSSPCVLLALEDALQNANGDSHLWLTAFGAGFAAHACELSRG